MKKIVFSQTDQQKNQLSVILAKEAVAKSKKALNHKDTGAQRKSFLSAGRSLDRLGKNFVFLCLCGSLLLELNV